MKTFGILAVLLLVCACADPMRDVERLAEVTLPADGAVASIAPGAADAADAPLVLEQLLAGTSAPAEAPPQAAVATGFWAQFSAPAVDASAVAADGPRAASGPDAAQVAPGTLLPYGQIASVCGQAESAFGSRIAVGSGYELYDSAPQTTALRPHYLTGFDDGCARIFSAALVLFGDIGTHEMVRYLPSNDGMSQSQTDIAYEQVKAQFCGVSAGQPCGRNLDRLDAHTTFVTIYETFGTNERWGEIFLHDGRVMAIDLRHG